MLLVAGACAHSGDGAETSNAGGEPGLGAAGAPRSSLASCPGDLCFPYTCDPSWDACRTQCFEGADCVDGFSCEMAVCVGTECTPATARETCGPYACERGLCAENCSESGCAEGYYCRGDTSECVPRCATSEDSICRGYLCDLDVQECEPICFEGGPGCASGFSCSERGMCVAD